MANTLAAEIKDLFSNVERYVIPFIGGESLGGLSRQECLVLSLQNINRFNIHLGKISKSSKDESGTLHLLQLYVNNLTVALKNENKALMKSSIASIRNMISEIEKVP